MIRTHKISVTTTGANGSAAGTGTTVRPVSGCLLAVYVDYTNQPATTDLVIATANAPVQTLLTLTNVNTDGWYYPRVQVHGTTGAGLTYNGTQTVNEEMPIDDYVTATVAQGDSAKTVDVYLLVED